MKKLLLATTMIVALAGGAAAYAETITTQTVTKTETTQPVSGVAHQNQQYTVRYDRNGDGMLEEDEFKTYTFSRWDTDGDGFLGDEEWNYYTNLWYAQHPQTQRQTYVYWDKDKNGKLDASELDTLVSETKLYSIWDTNQDGKVDNEEYAQASFKIYDRNNDGELSASEWRDTLR